MCALELPPTILVSFSYDLSDSRINQSLLLFLRTHRVNIRFEAVEVTVSDIQQFHRREAHLKFVKMDAGAKQPVKLVKVGSRSLI